MAGLPRCSRWMLVDPLPEIDTGRPAANWWETGLEPGLVAQI